MDKNHSWNSHSGNKGFIFTLDALIALFIIAITITVSGTFLLKNLNQNINSLQIEKIGADAIAVLDYNNDFNGLNKKTIESKINNIMPNNYDLSFKMECQNITVLSGNPPIRAIHSGERIIVTNKLDYCYMRYWIWEK